MRVVVQRVRWAEVEADGKVVGRVERGLLAYVGVGVDDAPAEADYLAEKVAHLRIFDDEDGKLNRSVQDVRGGVLAVPNFTLMADARKGRRPSFEAAAPGETAGPLHERFVEALKRCGCQVACGAFGQHMIIRSAADGPVNVILETPPRGASGRRGKAGEAKEGEPG